MLRLILELALTLITFAAIIPSSGRPELTKKGLNSPTFLPTFVWHQGQARKEKRAAELSVVIDCLALSRGREYALTASENGVLSIKKFGSPGQLARFQIDTLRHLYVAALCFDLKNDERVFYAVADGVFSWNWKEGRQPMLLVTRKPDACKEFLEVSTEGMAASGNGKWIVFIDRAQQVFLLTLPEPGGNDGIKISMIQESQTRSDVGYVYKFGAVAISPDSSRIAYTSRDVIKIFDTKHNMVVGRLSAHKDIVSSLAFLDNERLLSGSWDGTSRLWTITKSESVPVPLEKKMVEFVFVAASSDKKRFACCGADGVIEAFSFPDLKKIARIQGPESGFSGISFLNDARFLVTSGECPRLQFWNLDKQSSAKGP